MNWVKISVLFFCVGATKLTVNSGKNNNDLNIAQTALTSKMSKKTNNNIAKSLSQHKDLKSIQRVPRAATAHKERLWDFGVIPYEISENFQGRLDLVKQAMRHWENHTCIKFVDRNKDEHKNYLLITERACGCCSFFVGKKGGEQEISLAQKCKFGNILHELGHAIGFWHEHSRPDRDQHVNIVKENIISGWEGNFNKLETDEVDTLGLTYDYNSIMHYARTGFAKGKYLQTILPIGVPDETQLEIGQRRRLSAGDITQTNILYRCPKCGQTFQGNSGSFQSPPKQEKCEWRITATHGENIVLTIIDLDLDCDGSYLEVREGYWQKSPILAKFCGVKSNEIVTSLGSRLLVTYVTKNSNHRGFRAHYQAVCGGDFLIDDSKHLESPNYPEDYHQNKECIWRVTVPKTYKIALKFNFFELEHSENCLYDHLEIRDGYTPNGTLLGVFCGDDLPSDIISNSNEVFLKFVSDESLQKGGFSISVIKEFDECLGNHGCAQECLNTLGSYKCQCRIGYELQPDGKNCQIGCGGVLETQSGTIMTPNFPYLYPLNKTCVWEIVAPLQHRVVLNFTHFDIEGNSGDSFYKQVCEYDKLEVLSKVDGGKMEKHGTFCGSTIPEVLMSKQSVLRLVFNSDDDMEKTGFAAFFFADLDECGTNNGGCEHKCANTINSYKCSCPNGFILHENGHNCTKGDCIFEITAPFGSFGTPNYPGPYSNSLDCVWKFTTTPGHRLRVSFLIFEIEHHVECIFDQVEFYDGSSSDDRSLGKFCGSDLPQTVTSSGNELYMTFQSDESNQKKGFWATYSSICGGLLEVSLREQTIFSHARFGESNYDDKTDCEWTVMSIPGYNIKLSFLKFDVEFEKDCSFDYVEIFSDEEADARFCGSTKPPDFISSEDSLVVRFRTDDSFTNKGFSLVYQAVNKKYH